SRLLIREIGCMSHDIGPSLDSPSQDCGAAAAPTNRGGIIERTTDEVPPRERLAFWREGVLRRMEPTSALDPDRPFRGRLRRILGPGVELIEHASDGVVAERTARRCAADGCDDVSIDLMIECTSAVLVQGGRHKVRPGDLYIMDYAQPIH